MPLTLSAYSFPAEVSETPLLRLYEQFGFQIALEQPHMSADGARRDALFGRCFQEALMSPRRFECLERIERGQIVRCSCVPGSGIRLNNTDPD